MQSQFVARLRRSIGLAIVVAAGALSFAACAGSASSGANAPAPQAMAPAPQATLDGILTIDVSENDDGFAPREIRVRAGQKVLFNFINRGPAVHNMRIAGGDGRYNTTDDAVTDPAVVVAGSKAKIDWQAPPQPGKLIFRCDYHPDKWGSIVVR